MPDAPVDEAVRSAFVRAARLSATALGRGGFGVGQEIEVEDDDDHRREDDGQKGPAVLYRGS